MVNARHFIPPAAARAAKRLLVHPRFEMQRRRCRAGFRVHGHAYRNRTLFIAGLPKSGTTWLERMIAAFPGFDEALIPEVTAHELRTGGSHDFELPADIFDRFRDSLVVTKMHVHGSNHNAGLLKQAGIRYVVLFRDLRDVAVSYHHYVRRTPWHPEYERYNRLSVTEGLAVFGIRTLPAYAEWVRSWHRNLDPQLGLIVRYEDLRMNTAATLSAIAAHFELGDSTAVIEEIAGSHTLEQLRGQADASNSFFRKGAIGDWRNHLSPELRSLYKSAIGDFLIEFGYEQDLNW